MKTSSWRKWSTDGSTKFLAFFTGKGGVGKTSLACTTEIAACDEFTVLLTESELVSGYDRIVFDTAPTGHTLRLMKLPAAWSSFIETNESVASCLGPLSGLEKQRQRYSEAVAALADPKRTRLILLSRPDSSALAEADRTRSELGALGVSNQWLIINGVMPAESSDDPLAQAMIRRGRDALDGMNDDLRHAATGIKMFTPMMRLQDPEQTEMLIVTLPETTPVLEAAALQEDLRRAGIEPWWWVINSSLLASHPTDSLLIRRARAESAIIERVTSEFAQRVAITPWLARQPMGSEFPLQLTANDLAREKANVERRLTSSNSRLHMACTLAS